MAQDSLVKYIRDLMMNGYNTELIRPYLLKYGYSESQINDALQYIYSPAEVKHVHHLSKMTIALFIAVIFSLVLISLSLFIYQLPEKTPSRLLDIKTNIITPLVKQGEPLQFSVEMYNLGKARRYDILLRYEVYNLNDELITFKEETIAIETKTSSIGSIDLKDVVPGKYYLKTIASKEQAKAISTFSVIKEDTTAQQSGQQSENPLIIKCPASCDDINDCTNDYCNDATHYECKHTQITPCCGNAICEFKENYSNCPLDCKVPEEAKEDLFKEKSVVEIIDLAKSIAKRDAEEALRYCKKIDVPIYQYQCFTGVGVSSKNEEVCLNIGDDPSKELCYKEIAEETNSSIICSKIIGDMTRDQCYLSFIKRGDYTVCDKVINDYLRQGCNSLKELSNVKPIS